MSVQPMDITRRLVSDFLDLPWLEGTFRQYIESHTSKNTDRIVVNKVRKIERLL